MQFTKLSILGFGAVAFAQDLSSSEGGGIAITSRSTMTNVDESTSLVPVLTPDVATSTNVEVDTEVSQISETTDIGTTPTNTIVEFATTTDIGLQSGYAFTTDESGSTVPTYTGTGTAPSLTSTPSAGGAGGGAIGGATTTATDTTARTTTATESEEGAAIPAMTAAPYFAAAAMVGAMAFAA